MSKATRFLSFMMAVLMLFTVQLKAADKDSGWVLGKEWVQHLKEDYNQGKFTSFLKEIDEQYLKDKEEGKWEKIHEQIKAFNTKSEDPQQKQSRDEFQVKIENYSKDFLVLQDETKEKLLAVKQKHPQYSICKAIDDYAAHDSFDASNNLVSLAFSNILEDAPNENPFNEYLDIAKEFWLKQTLVYEKDPQNLRKSKYDDLETSLVVIDLAKFKKMRAHKNRVDLADAIEEYYEQRAVWHNQYVLQAFGDGDHTPANPAEEEIKKIMEGYSAKRDELVQKHGLNDFCKSCEKCDSEEGFD